jgi:hypothetical protein
MVDHTEETVPAVDATCTATGLTEGKKCSVCETVLVAQKTVPATGVHVYTNASDKQCDTCTHTRNYNMYLMSSLSEWTVNENYRLTESADGKTWSITITFENVNEFKVYNAIDDVWIGNSSNYNNNFKVTSGTYVITYNTTTKKASCTAQSYIVYLTPNSNWTSSKAWFAVYYWYYTGSTKHEGWAKMTLVSGTSYYKAEIPSAAANLIFCRMNSGKTSLEWGSVWNQTNDLTVNANGNNMYTVAAGAWSKGNGSWSEK